MKLVNPFLTLNHTMHENKSIWLFTLVLSPLYIVRINNAKIVVLNPDSFHRDEGSHATRLWNFTYYVVRDSSSCKKHRTQIDEAAPFLYAVVAGVKCILR